jgi:hypothetical protein
MVVAVIASMKHELIVGLGALKEFVWNRGGCATVRLRDLDWKQVHAENGLMDGPKRSVWVVGLWKEDHGPCHRQCASGFKRVHSEIGNWVEMHNG